MSDDPRFALSETTILTDENADDRGPGLRVPAVRIEPGPDPKPIAIVVQPARTVNGRVTDAETGRPVSHALVKVDLIHLAADAEGRFRAQAPVDERVSVMAQGAEGAPYLIANSLITWPKGAVEQTVDLALNRGVVVHGKITEEGTGRPVAGAVVRFAPNPAAAPGPFQGIATPAASCPDGTYRVAAPIGPGYLVVQGPDDDYVLREFGAQGGLNQAQPGRRRFYASAYRFVDLKPGTTEQEVDLTVRRGAAVHVRAVGPDGQPIRSAWVYSRIVVAGGAMGGWKEWRVVYDRCRGQVRDGHFALHGLDADGEVPAYFLEPERKLGATTRFSGRSGTGGPVTVRLEPLGAARARLVGPDGQPVDRFPAVSGLVTMVLVPGPPRQDVVAKQGPLFATESSLVPLDPVNHADEPRSDAHGRLTLPALIPARLIASWTARRPSAAASPRSARSSPSSPARCSTWATSSSPSPGGGIDHESHHAFCDRTPPTGPDRTGRCRRGLRPPTRSGRTGRRTEPAPTRDESGRPGRIAGRAPGAPDAGHPRGRGGRRRARPADDGHRPRPRPAGPAVARHGGDGHRAVEARRPADARSVDQLDDGA